jgi:EmrB/QacA subfamily drug resistance transporter
MNVFRKKGVLHQGNFQECEVVTPQSARRKKVFAMLGLGLVLFLVSLDQTVVGTAMPQVIAELNGFEWYAWVATAYLLTETTAIPIVGKLGDLYGRKWITIAGVAIFVASSAMCGMATSMLWLIIWRGLQGLGGGMLFSTIFALVADIYPDLKDRARYQGLLFSVFAVSSVIGPVAGGWITDSLSWRWVFYVNLPLGLLALGVLPLVLPQNPRQPKARIDYLGALTITTSVVALLLALEWVGAGYGWSSPQVIGGFVVAALSFAVFVPLERRAVEPIIPFSLFRNRTVSATSWVLFLVGIAMFGVILYTPLFMQGVLGLSATASGMAMIPMVVTMTGMGILVGNLIARFETIKPFLLFGLGVMSLGFFLLTTLHSNSNPLLVSGFLFIVALGLGTVNPVTTLAVQAAVEPRVLGVATSATQFIRSIGSTAGTAVIGTLVANSYVARLTAGAPTGTPGEAVSALHSPNALINQEALQSLAQLMATAPNSIQMTQTLLDTARIGLANAIQAGFFFMLGAAILALAGAFLTANLRLDRPRETTAIAIKHGLGEEASGR